MTDLERYLAEEVAIDHADGFITRREALHRLALMGWTAGSASSLLAACASEGKTAPAPAPPPGASAADAAAAASAVTFAGPEGRTLQGGWAGAEKPRGAVLVIHENKGLLEHFRVLAGRFARAGYSALAIDLLSEEGGTAALGDPANATAALSKVAPERFVADMKAGLDELARRAPGVKLGAIGFCFGGGMTWRLIASKDPRLAAAAPFYGPLPDGADFTGSRAAVLGVYAEADARVNASRETAKAALEKAGLVHEIVTYAGADHAFFNDTGPRYQAEAAAQAWTKVLAWFGHYLG
ncbi:dienelactone hydrolase family protein [Pendulispora albinea]|uniref:Dienelactone hydrolase family protein n=1 Tax=Pendulispora albinea TaxID=2741071 RepID=A0ABZ2MCC3_9BACT